MKSRKLLPLASSRSSDGACFSAEPGASGEGGREARGSFVNCEDLGSKEEKVRHFEAFFFGQEDSVCAGHLSRFLVVRVETAARMVAESASEVSLS